MSIKKGLVIANPCKQKTEIKEDEYYYVLDIEKGTTEIYSGLEILNNIFLYGEDYFMNICITMEDVPGLHHYRVLYQVAPMPNSNGLVRFRDNINLIVIQNEPVICIIDDTWYCLQSFYNYNGDLSGFSDYLDSFSSLPEHTDDGCVVYARSNDFIFYYEERLSSITVTGKVDWSLKKLFSGVSIKDVKKTVLLSGVILGSEEFERLIKNKFIDKYYRRGYLFW